MQTNAILRFPREQIKLSYENVIHKKVYDNDWFVAIPEGKKMFAWFTMHGETNQPMCVLVPASASDRSEGKPVHACFNKRLVYGGDTGTILYGTVFMYEKNKVFSVEDVLYYRGQNHVHTVYREKLSLFQTLFQTDIHPQAVYGDSFVVFGLPVMKSTCAELLQCVASLSYTISHIQYRYTQKGTNVEPILGFKYVSGMTTHANANVHAHAQRNEAVFKVRADIQNDIYHLYVYHNGSRDHEYDLACIPDYKTSVMMNRLFRIIKENENLDALEESDDEAEFESDRVDKFVHLEKDWLMRCQYHWKFKRWVPVAVVKSGEKMVTLRDLQPHQQKQYKKTI